MEWFSTRFPGAISSETLDGIHIVRAGRQWTVHIAAFRYYRKTLSEQFDVVVDQINTIPFFTPLWANVPIVMLIHQLAREVWWYESKFPMSAFGFLAEPLYLRVYRKSTVLTVSASTKQDLQRLGLTGPITVIPEGVESPRAEKLHKANDPTFLYVGRLTPSKRVDHILRAVASFRKRTGSGYLWIIGTGPPGYQLELVQLTQRLSLEPYVTFWGRVSTEEKYRLMAQAHLLLMTSVREGWGLVVTEANACGTPAIVYNVPGLRDSVRNEVTGLIVRDDPSSLSEAMSKLIADHTSYDKLACAAKVWSASFSLDETARIFGNALRQVIAS